MSKRSNKNTRRKLRQKGRFELSEITPQECERINADDKPCICIVGSGASGMACAAALSSLASANVVVLERDHYRGRTILASGNGRCNFSHFPLDVDQYHNKEFVAQVHEGVSHDPFMPSVLEWFDSLGLVWREMPSGSGMLYPYSNRATAVTDVLNAHFDHSQVLFFGNACVSELEKQGSRWHVVLGDCSFFADVVVLACGGNALQGVSLSCAEDISMVPCHGVLGPLAIEETIPEELDGLRADVVLQSGDFCEQGEVLFRTYGLSGIVAFNASRYMGSRDTLRMNCVPQYSDQQLHSLFEKRLTVFSGESLVDACRGFIDPALVRFACQCSQIDPASSFSKETILPLVHALTSLDLTVIGVAEGQLCQVQRGGVATEVIDPQTMSVKSDSSLFVVGELVDVDGPCGGYNLNWAWTTGLVAGTTLVRRFS